MFKKLMSVLLLVGFVVGLSGGALASAPTSFALESNSNSDVYTASQSEYEMFQDLKTSTTAELEARGCTAEEIEIIQETSFEDLLYERAQLPEETLKSYGYTQAEVEILKDYSGELISSDSAVRAVLATCSGRITCNAANTQSITVSYKWNWSSVPLWVWTDSVALNWKAIDANGYDLNASAINKTLNVDYYKVYGKVDFTRNYSSSITTQTSFDAIHGEFKMQIPQGTVNPQALSGTLKAEIKIDGSQPLSLVKVAAGYGHCTVTGTIGFSVVQNGDFGFSFVPSVLVQTLASQRVKIDRFGKVTNLD